MPEGRDAAVQDGPARCLTPRTATRRRLTGRRPSYRRAADKHALARAQRGCRRALLPMRSCTRGALPRSLAQSFLRARKMAGARMQPWCDATSPEQRGLQFVSVLARGLFVAHPPKVFGMMMAVL